MILDRLYENYTVEGKTFVVGGTVWANEHTGWSGLRGRVTKIVTPNSAKDPAVCLIHCDFEEPDSSQMKELVAFHYRTAYHTNTPFTEIQRDNVILTPDALDPIAPTLPEPKMMLYALSFCVFGDSEPPSSTMLGVSSEKDLLFRLMEENTAKYKVPLMLISSSFLDETILLSYEEKDCEIAGKLYVYLIERVPVYSTEAEVAA